MRLFVSLLLLCLAVPQFALAGPVPAPTAAPAAAPVDAAERAAMGALAMAKHLYSKGKYKKAAAFFRQAYDVKPIPEFLFNAARAEQRGYQLKAAERDFVTLLAMPKLDATMRRRAAVHLKEVREAMAHESRLKADAAAARVQAQKAQALASAAKQDEERRAAAQKAAQQQRSRRSAWQERLKWPLLGVGVVALGFGTWSMLDAGSQQGDLDTHKDTDTGKFRHTISLAEARTQQAAINGGYFTGWVSLGLGAALAGAGGWLWLTSSRGERAASALTVVPLLRERGVALTWQF